ncbi:alpha-mannosidase [Enterococcus sp. DIV1314a]|uniref:alpha-mannosidase n=1 Tax=Enterococcus sp. DIV1314a TaxID=2774660 RepID=UPI003F26E9E8
MTHPQFEFERIRKIFFKVNRYKVKERRVISALSLDQGNGFEPYEQGDYFGKKNTDYTIKGTFTIPEEWRDYPVAFEGYADPSQSDNSTNPQMKVYLNDHYLQALDTNHREVVLADEWKDAGEINFTVPIFSGREEKKFPLHFHLIAYDQATYDFYYDLMAIYDSWRGVMAFGGDAERYQQTLVQAVNLLDFRQPYSKSYYQGIEAAKEVLASMYLIDHVPTQKVTAVGHTHIDLAWLWTVQQAIEKGERSFQTVFQLMDEYPDYTFINSQPQQYQFMKDHYPELYAKIKEKIKEGRWEAEGAMWVEADCNLTSGESLVRQVLYGKRFLKEEFDVDSKILWLPDVFGYSAALPQILQKTNTPYFMTTKLNWNQFNQIPYDSFYWQGIDGSKVLTHFITTISEHYNPTPYYSTYNGLLDPYTVKGSFERYQQKAVNDEILLAYGYGDGGGGPTREMLEIQKRLQQPLPDMPTITGDRAGAFFDRLSQKEKLPTWYGELYFEYHRGTLTSIGKNKKYNREIEFLLQNVEKCYAQYAFDRYPQEALERMWKVVLLNQFHDILPGSSIEEVYEQTDREYEAIIKECHDLLSALPLVQQESVFTLYNALGFQRASTIMLPVVGQAVDGAGHTLVSQLTHQNQLLVKTSTIPSLASEKVNVIAQPVAAVVLPSVEKQFETADFKVKLNDAFEIISLFDKQAKREMIPTGEKLNQLVAYEDIPMDYDAWDIDVYYQEKSWNVDQIDSIEWVEKGPIRDTLKVVRPFENSMITQYIHFYHGTKRIDFETKVDWQLNQVLLKAQMPIAVNTLEATYDIQFGNVTRNVHKNTTWDWARFESCGQKWVDLSEGNYGVSLLSDAKYGFSTEFQKIGITLIKSAIDPYPNADNGQHAFTYSLFAHEGNWQQGHTMEEALDLNVPLMVFDGDLNENTSFFEVDMPNVLLDTVKKAEDDEAIVLRLYEYMNRQTQVRLTSHKEIERAVLCNMLEEAEEELAIGKNHIDVAFKPFEVQTIKVYFK